jgi:Spy/CpxP family protein refolding chaperone
MKKVIIIAALLLAGTTFAQGPEGRDPKEIAAKRAERMATELGLNAEQRTRLEAIFLYEAEQMKAIREKHEAEMRSVLTPEQYAAWEQKRAEKKAKMMERRKAQRANP